MESKKQIWSYKNRHRDSYPQTKGGPVCETDYKEPDIICYWQEDNNEQETSNKLEEQRNVQSSNV